MKPRELFAVAVKSVGLYFIVQGIWSLLRILDVVVPLIMSREEQLQSHQRMTIGTFLAVSVIYFAISALFMRGSGWFVDFAFPRQTDRVDSPTDADRAAS